MGQKTNPIGNRLGIIRGWDSNWYGGKDYGDKLAEDEKIRKYIFIYSLKLLLPSQDDSLLLSLVESSACIDILSWPMTILFVLSTGKISKLSNKDICSFLFMCFYLFLLPLLEHQLCHQ